MPAEEKKYNPGFDLIRITSMMAVMLIHLTTYLPIPNRWKFLFTWGSAGVPLFFVLSGFLAARTFVCGGGTAAYYKKRALRILPAYYGAVLAAAVFRQFIIGDVTGDIFGLGWLRYFLGLNTVLPSNAYDVWNNTYGLWTMSCFLWFYVLAPGILRRAQSLKRAVVLLFLMFVLSELWRNQMYELLSPVPGLDELDLLLWNSPICSFYKFAMGILAYVAVKGGKPFEGILLVALSSAGLQILGAGSMLWCIVCAVSLIAFENLKITLPARWTGLVRLVGRESYHVYLGHLLAFNIGRWILNRWFPLAGKEKYLLWLVFAGTWICLLCGFMNFCEAATKRLFCGMRRADS